MGDSRMTLCVGDKVFFITCDSDKVIGDSAIVTEEGRDLFYTNSNCYWTRSVVKADKWVDPVEQSLKPFNGKEYIESFNLKSELFTWIHRKGYFDIKVLNSYFPNWCPDNPGMIFAWIDEKGREKGKSGRVMMKSGRLFRRLNCMLSDSIIDSLVDEFKEEFVRQEITIFESKDKEDFINAYAGEQVKNQNICTTNIRKSLANSCMRYNNFDIHPALAYASGDFSIVWARDSNGFIAARSVVYLGNNSFAPIYANSNQVMAQMESYLESKGYEDAHDWSGAKLLRIERQNQFVVPYTDIGPEAARDDSDYLVYDSSGTICLQQTSGLSGDDSYSCEGCGDRMSEAYICSGPDDCIYCEDCYADRFGYCERTGEPVDIDELETVIVRIYPERTEQWGSYARDDSATYIEHRSQWHKSCLTLTDGHGESICESDISDGDWSLCPWNEEYYPSSDLSQIEGGEYVLTSDLKADPSYQLNDDGIWYNVHEDTELTA